MNIARSIEHGARMHPERTAILFEGSEISYRELDRRVNRAASVLHGLGVCPGDRVAIHLPNVPEFAVAYLGVVKIGAIAVSVNPNLTQSEVNTVLNDSGSRVLVTTDSQPAISPVQYVLTADELTVGHAECVEAIDLDPGSPAAILYTSGTTGVPKGATLSHSNIEFTRESKKRYLGIRPDDRMLLFLPLYHCFGQNAILNSCLHAGATIVLHRGFDADAVLASIVRDRVTMFCGVPTTFIVLHDAASPEQMKSVRYFFSAAASLPVEVETKWRRKFGAIIHQGYGLTETSPFAAYNHTGRHKPGSIGTPIDGVEMRIADVADGRILPDGEKGEIVVRGPNVMLGYWNRPEATCEAIRNGWFHTGDIGRLDEDGYFYVEDRLKDMIIVGGSNVYPAEIENVLYQHCGVAEAAVYGVPDAVMGELGRAAVVLKPGFVATGEELLAHCRRHLAAFKVPAQIEFTCELPKSRTGKVLKRVLREQHSAEYTQTASLFALAKATSRHMTQDTNDLQHRIADWLGGKLRIDANSIDFKVPFSEYGLTSLMAVELAKDLAEWTGRSVVPTVTWSFSTVESLAAHLVERRGTSPAASPEIDLSMLSEHDAEAMLLRELEQLSR
jgi:long-chain acyl-CoA synthetase